MRKQSLLAVLVAGLLQPALGWAAPEPHYTHDPFGDSDLNNTPLIANKLYPNQGRYELSLMVSGNVAEKYTSHIGGLLDANYTFWRDLGVGLTFGYMHGQLSGIVTAPQGVIGNRATTCQEQPSTCEGLDPAIPDQSQITGLLSAHLMWAPIYGKLNLVSELDTALQLYVLAGMGVNGTRRARPVADAATQTGFRLAGGGAFDGGFFSNPKLHGTFGLGVRFFLMDWIALRGEVRTIMFRDSFDFNEDGAAESYTSVAWLGQGGVAFLF